MDTTTIRRRTGWYAAGVGAAVGMLLTGLVLPLAVDEQGGRVASVRSQDGPLEATTTPPPGVEEGGTAEPEVGTDPADPAPAPTAGSASSGSAGPAGRDDARPDADPTAPSAGTARTASDVGVSADRVKVGFLLLDIGGLGQVGVDVGISVEQQQAAVQAFVDERNERGGVNGRRIEPVYQPVNLLDPDAGRVACAELTQDEKVFISTGHLPRPEDVQCFTVQHRALLLTTNIHGEEAYRRSEGRLLTLQMRGGRLMQNWVRELDRVRYLEGHDVGIVTDEGFDEGGVTAERLKRALESAGHEVVRVSRLARDYHTGSGQIPVEVNQMRAAGAGAVFLLANSIMAQQWVQQADGQGWHPRYTTSPWAAMDTNTSNENMPASYAGTIGVASLYPKEGTAEPARAAACRSTYERRSGDELAGRDTNEYGVTMLFCDAVHGVAVALERAGTNPTKASMIEGFARVGTLEGLAWAPGGSWRPGKPDLLDQLRLQRWDSGCRCFRPAGPYRRVQI